MNKQVATAQEIHLEMFNSRTVVGLKPGFEVFSQPDHPNCLIVPSFSVSEWWSKGTDKMHSITPILPGYILMILRTNFG